MRAPETAADPTETALRALVWTLADPRRGARLLDLTGLTPRDLKTGAGDPAVLGAVLGFLENNEPDLIACADGIGVAPAALTGARAALENAGR